MGVPICELRALIFENLPLFDGLLSLGNNFLVRDGVHVACHDTIHLIVIELLLK